MVIEMSPLCSRGNSNGSFTFIPLLGSTIADACRFNEFQRARSCRTLPHERNWMALRAGCEPACIIAKELDIRNKILAIAAIAGAMSAPVATQAQSVVTTGVAP